MAYSPAAGRRTESFTPDRLLTSTKDLRTRRVTMAAGQNLPRGAVLGQITIGGNYALSESGATDGSQVPRYILAEACNATAAATECLVYETGDFNEQAVTLGAGHTIASIREGLRTLGIFFSRILPA